MMFAKEAGVTVNVEVADITGYEPEGQFDIIICNGVLQYIDDKRRSWSECRWRPGLAAQCDITLEYQHSSTGVPQASSGVL